MALRGHLSKMARRTRHLRGQLSIEALVAIAAFLALLAALIGAAAVAGDATEDAQAAMTDERLKAAAVLENEVVAGEGIEFGDEYAKELKG
ncbi:MAG: hypothetical protein Q7T16_05770 [Candidatus Burarchaeum sp.]|nr:hypothetical protein [Candidatus Burarchaeum sp.]MDO8340134.1 hypothetical protein [Candidatus Burarchaeum sp.]